jgi:CheY-like chemotaxis protein
MKIMIIDDDKSLRTALSFHLLNYGHSVSMASNGKEALAILNENCEVDLLICDVMMPELSGPSFLLSLKKLCPKGLPVITIITSVRDGEQFLKKLDVKYDYFLPKPVDFGKLDSIISKLDPSKER